MRVEIKSRFSGSVLFSVETSSLKLALEAGIRSGADLSGADLSDADLGGANLGGANLRGANLGDANLRGANLRGADLRGADLGDANLRGANLRGADLSDADLGGANLRGANLSDADLGGADLGDANLRGADLRGADLGDANLRGANLGDADLSDADLGDAKFSFKPDPSLPRRVAESIINGADGPKVAMDSWHKCETVHCIAGWAIHLSGPAGYALESVVGAATAGVMLMPSAAYMFYKSNDEAIAWAKEQLNQ